MQVQPGGSVGRIGVVMNPNRKPLKPLFLNEQTITLIDGRSTSPDPSPDIPTQTLTPSDPPAATSESTALKDMFERFDVSCNELGDTLLEVVIALTKTWGKAGAEERVEAQVNAKLRDVLRGSMPCMVGRRRLVIRRHKSDYDIEDLARNVFERDPRQWKDIKLDS